MSSIVTLLNTSGGSVPEPVLVRAIATHRKAAPGMYRGLGLSRIEEEAMVAALRPLVEALEQIASLPENGLGGTGAAPRIALEALHGF